MCRSTISVLIVLFTVVVHGGSGTSYLVDPPVEAQQTSRITIRTENFPRPPYSGATYYIYERDGEAICTKLEVCNKFGDCSVTYRKGAFREEEDIETGEPYGKTKAVVIPKAKLNKHACLTKFKLVKPK